jgi:two-component system response regulator GlrR
MRAVKEARSRQDATETRPTPVAAPLGARLVVHGAPASSRAYVLREGRCVVGAGKGADLLVQHATVSRRHVELTLVPEGVVLRDLQSRNGTRFLGQVIREAVLSLGSRVQIGDVWLDIEAEPLPEVTSAGGPSYRGLVGVSAAMGQLFGRLARLEGSLVNVLIEGPSGSGKELVARALHEGSLVADGPFVAINCGALRRELVSSELFGHAKGAFTGAHEAKRGMFEVADGGTLFLDELGELPLDVQPSLLRVIESGALTRVGEVDPRPVRLRLICATHRDLRADVSQGRFREDLFYRLAVVRVRVPPLDERREDVPLLAHEFARHFGASALPAEVVHALGSRLWPGNVRELRNQIQSYLALGELDPVASAPDAPAGGGLEPFLNTDVPYHEQKSAVLAHFTRLYLEQLLARTGGNRTDGARLAGVERSYLSKMIERYGVER